MEHHEPGRAGSRAGMVGAAIETVVRAHDEHWAASRRPARGVTGRGRKRSQQSRRTAAPEHGPRQREASEKRRRAWERSARARGARRPPAPATAQNPPLLLFKRETEHLWLRQLMHGIGEGPR